MADEAYPKGYTSEEGTGDLRIHGDEYKWMGQCVQVGPATRPQGDITVSKCRSGRDPSKFVPFSVSRTAPDDITFDLIAPLNKAALISERILACPVDIRKRYSKCLTPESTRSWEMIHDYLDVYTTQITESHGTPPGIDEATSNVLETMSMKALCLDIVRRVDPTRIGEGQTVLDINAVSWCSPLSCGECEDISDGCVTFAAVTDSGLNYLDTPYLIIATRNYPGWVFNYVLRAIDPFNAGGEHAVDHACLPEGRHLVISTVAQALAWTDDAGINWVNVPLVAAGAPTRIYAPSWVKVYVVGNAGYIYRSRNGAATFETVDAGATFAQNLADIHGYGERMVVVGALNEFGTSTDEGDTWNAGVGPAAGVNLNVVRMLGEREVLVGTADGRIFRSLDFGVTWAEVEVVDFADMLGAAAEIVAWDWCGCREDKGFVLVNSGGTGYVFRTIDHAMTFDFLRDSSQAKIPMPDNDELNDIACCDPNIAAVVGEASGGSGFMALIKD